MTRLRRAFISERGAAIHTAALILTTIGITCTAAIVLTLLGSPPVAVGVASLMLGVMAGRMMDGALLRLHLSLAREQDGFTGHP